MSKILAIVIGFFHDFVAGCWAASVFAVYWLDRQSVGFQVIDTIIELKKQFFFLGIGCIVFVLLTGAGRGFTYVENVYGAKNERARKKLLILKHVLLFTVFGIGTYWQYIMVFE